jgi:hypothetical protein
VGHGLSTHCKRCGRQDTYTIGIGMAYYSLENVLNCLSPRNREKVKKILAEYKVDATEYEHRLYSCPTCLTLHNRFFVRMEYDGGKIFETSYRCGKCRRQLFPVKDNKRGEIDFGSFLCKSCGQPALEGGLSIMWD